MTDNPAIEAMARAVCAADGCYKYDIDDLWHHYISHAQAAYDALAAAGFAVVPVEPTEAMVQAAWQREPKHPNPTEAYRAMIAAAKGEG